MAASSASNRPSPLASAARSKKKISTYFGYLPNDHCIAVFVGNRHIIHIRTSDDLRLGPITNQNSELKQAL